MRRIVGVVASLLVLSSVALAADATKPQHGIFILGGYMYAQGVALQTSGSLGGVGGPVVDIDAHIGITPRVSISLGCGGYEAKSWMTSGASRVDVKVRNISIPILARYYLSDPGKARFYIAGGPSVNFIKNTGSAATGALAIFSGSASSTKPGGTIQAGGHIPVSKSIVIQFVTGYNYVPKFNTVNPSCFTMMAGIGYVWQRK